MKHRHAPSPTVHAGHRRRAAPRRIPALGLAAFMAAVAGCEVEEGQTTPAEVAEESREAAGAAGRFASERWVDFTDTMQSRLSDLERRIDALDRRAGEASDEARAAAEAAVADLRRRRAALADELAAARTSGEAAWDEVAAGLEAAWRDLDQAARAAAARLERSPGDDDDAGDTAGQPGGS